MNRLSIISCILATTAFCFAGGGCSSDTDNNGDAGVSDGSSSSADSTISGEDGTASPDGTLRPDGSTMPGDGTTVPDTGGPTIDCGALNRETLADGSCGACTSGSDEIVITACNDTLSGEDCLRVIDEDELRGVEVSCEEQPDTCRFDDGDCANGCIDRVGFGFVLPERTRVGAVRFLSDWWSKRPGEYQVWLAESEGQFPGGGATLLATGEGNPNPWQCVAGEECGPLVPDACCLDGRDAPQRLPEGDPIALYDYLSFFDSEVEGVQVYLEVRGSRSPNTVYLNDVRFYSAVCSTSGDPCSDACAEGVECEVVDGDAVCGECPEGTEGDGVTCTPITNDPCTGACAAGVSCEVVDESPVCGECPEGTSGDGVVCEDDDGCADSPCFEGVECTDEPAPGTGYSCGECPAGTTGDGETCTPVVCTPECAGWQSCVSGTCRPRSCSSQGQCPGAVCFEGTCREGSTCPTACSSRYGSGNWECVADGRCRKVDCRNSGECGGGRDCVSDSNNPRGTFDQTCSSSPCGGACESFQICSAERRACAP